MVIIYKKGMMAANDSMSVSELGDHATKIMQLRDKYAGARKIMQQDWV